MANDGPASQRFRAERQHSWQQLEALVRQAEQQGLERLDAQELFRIPLLYRACASSLSVARSVSLDANLVAYLESLASRAYFVVYGARSGLGALAGTFVWHRFPAAVRSVLWPIVLAGALMIGGVAAGWSITAADSAWFEAFVSEEMASGRTPAATREELAETLSHKPPPGEALAAFASFLFSNNARVGMMCFALGAALGVPVVVLLVYNGLALGAMCAVFAGKGLTAEFLAWLAIHGTTELTAVVICGGAGFHLAGAMIDPGRQSRMAALAARGRVAATLVLGAVMMLFCAALLEGFGRQLVMDTTARGGVGGVMLAAWCAYFACCGRKVPGRPRRRWDRGPGAAETGGAEG